MPVGEILRRPKIRRSKSLHAGRFKIFAQTKLYDGLRQFAALQHRLCGASPASSCYSSEEGMG